MPTKKTNLAANNLKQGSGWFPPIPDNDSNAANYHGTPSMYKIKQNVDYFHKIMKENLGFDLEADPEDVKKRIVATSKVGKLAIKDYLQRMEDISLMPDSPQKMEEFSQAAGALENALYQQLAKGRLVFIPLGETEPRQLLYNPNTGEFQVSGKLMSLKDYIKLDEEFIPKDKRGMKLQPKKEPLVKPEHPGEFNVFKPQPPDMPKPFAEYLRDMPQMEKLKPLREEPKIPENPRKGGKIKAQLVDEEFKRISADVEKPEYKYMDIPIPRFTLKVPEKVEKPDPPRDDMKEPVAPAIEKEIAKVEEQLGNAKDPVFPSEFKRVLIRKPTPVKEPYKPVLEPPIAPTEPDYERIPNEPVFKHPLPPKIEFAVPDFELGKPPVEPDQPVFLVYPDKPVLRTEPEEPARPGFFTRLFSSASVQQYEERHREWVNDHNAWVEERDVTFPQRMIEYGVRCAEVDQANQNEMNKFNEAAEAYIDKWNEYQIRRNEYDKQVEDLKSVNEANYVQFEADKAAYDRAKEELGSQYDTDYQAFYQEHKEWEKRNKEILEKNAKLKKDYENSPEYKKYIEEKKWYDNNMAPHAFDYNKAPEVKKQFLEEYEKNLEKYNTYLEEEKAYQNAVKPVRDLIEEEDRALNGKNPDYEQNKEARINEKLAANEKANLDYDKEMDDYKSKMENLVTVHQSYLNNPEHIKYVKEKEAYERNEALKTKKVIVKKQLPDESGIDYDVDYDKLGEDEKNKLVEKLDPVIISEKQALPSEKIVVDENNNAIVENDNSDALNYSFVEDMLENAIREDELQAESEEKKHELKPDEEEISLYEYELRRYNAYVKDQKYYNLMKKRYDEKKAEYDEKKSINDEWNKDIEQRITDYDNRMNALRITADSNVSQRLRTYDERIKTYDEDHAKWVEEKKDYDLKKDSLETRYILDMTEWKKEKAEYDKKRSEYDAEVKDYENRVNYYNMKVAEYNEKYKEYQAKLAKYENDVKINKAAEQKNLQHENDYNKKVEAYEKKLLSKSPALKDYKFNKGDYLNGSLQWGQELKEDTTVPEWKANMKNDQLMDKYFDDHQRKINTFNSYRIKCRNIKKIDPIQQQNYDAMMQDRAKYSRYSEQSRPFYRFQDMEEEKLNRVIDKMNKIDFRDFRDAATVQIYNNIVRSELQATSRDPDFNAARMAELVMDPKYKSDALQTMRNDATLVNALEKMYKDQLKLAKGEKQGPDFRLKNLLKEDSWKLTSLYQNRYENSKKSTIDPILKKHHGPVVESQKGGKGLGK